MGLFGRLLRTKRPRSLALFVMTGVAWRAYYLSRFSLENWVRFLIAAQARSVAAGYILALSVGYLLD